MLRNRLTATLRYLSHDYFCSLVKIADTVEAVENNQRSPAFWQPALIQEVDDRRQARGGPRRKLNKVSVVIFLSNIFSDS